MVSDNLWINNNPSLNTLSGLMTIELLDGDLFIQNNLSLSRHANDLRDNRRWH